MGLASSMSGPKQPGTQSPGAQFVVARLHKLLRHENGSQAGANGPRQISGDYSHLRRES